MGKHLILTSANVLVIRRGKVLLGRRQNTDWGNGLLCLPGGHIEAGETPRQGAVREIKEEVGLDIIKDRLRFCCVAARQTNEYEYVAYEFVLELTGQEEPVNTEPDRCSELIWCDPRNLPKDIIPDFRTIIEQGYLNKIPYLETGYK